MTATQLSPHHARRVTRTVGAISVASLDTGNLGDGTATLLLLPGFTGSKEDFVPLLDPLHDNGFRAIAVDLPGQYESPGPAEEAEYRPAELGRSIAALIADLPGPVVLLGHSFGGLVARAAVLHNAAIAGLMLLCSGPAALPEGLRRQAMRIGEPVIRTQGVEAAWKLREGLSESLRPQAVPADLQQFYRSRFLSSTPAGLIGMATALAREPDLVAELDDVLQSTRTPVSVISGEADDAWGLDLQTEMARRLDTTLVTIPGAGHSPNTEAPERLLRMLLPLLRSWTTRAG